MTFTEAAIEVLRREGKPLHFTKITEIAVRESLLDHVGKIPEETMADQLSAHGRLPRVERRVIPVQPGTFALVEWGLEEDPAGLENLVEPPPEDELAYRGRERHPVPSRDLARGASRGEGARARRRDDEERRGRRFPPPAEVAYEILAGAGRSLTLAEIAVAGAERLLMPDAFVREPSSLEAALSEDNRRRESAGRKPLFQVEAEAVTLVAQPEPGERAAVQPAARAAAAAGDARRSALGALRRRLRDCDGPTLEHVAVRLLEQLGFRDLRVAKRGREHVIYTGKRRMGLGDVRHGVRIIRSGADAGRRDVSDVRRDLGHYGAQLGMVVTAGDAARDARGEAGAAGQLPVVLLCGEALAEAFADAGVGCVPVVVPNVDEAFFRTAAEAAEKEEAARRARREERERREPARREDQARPGAAAEPAEAHVRPAEEAASSEPPPERDEDLEEDEESEEVGVEVGAEAGAESGSAAAEGTPPAEGGASGERRRRRRRRRRRGGRGRAREGSPPGGEGSQGQAPEPARAEGASETPPAEPPPPGQTPGDGGGSRVA
jgi:hypothetical protein